MVAETADGSVGGFVVYELLKTRLQVLNLAVRPDLRRRGIGRALVARLATKLTHQRRSRIMLEVRESNLAAQLFLLRQGFRAVNVLRDFYDQTCEDAYVFQYKLCLPALERAA